MNELGTPSTEHPHAMDSPGRNADVPFTNHQLTAEHDGHIPPMAPGQIDKDYEAYERDHAQDYEGVFDDPDLNAEDATHATSEVKQAMHQIKATEASIAEQLGRASNDPELPVLTDDALVHIAERSADYAAEYPEEAAVAEETVETVLIESALEATGNRPVSSGNPTVRLQNEGYNQQVVEGVRKLHEEGAVLPNGEEAAEAVARSLIIQEAQPEQATTTSAERARISDKLDTALQYYYKGGSKEDIQNNTGLDPTEITEYLRSLPEVEREYAIDIRRQALGENKPAANPQEMSVLPKSDLEGLYVNGIDSEESSVTDEQLEAWYKTLSEDDQARLASAKQEEADIREYITQQEQTIEHNLAASAAELLKGRLPQELADRIGTEYAIGVRQLGTDDATDAQEMLDTDGGVDVSNLNLIQSFNVTKESTDDWTAKDNVVKGYYGVRGGGKFVIAIPMHETSDPTTAYESIPDMHHVLQSSDNPDYRAVNPKYVAGYIDADGVFHPNENFMRSNEAKLEGVTALTPSKVEAASKESTNPYEHLTTEQLTAVRNNIADSIVQGIRKYDPAEVSRASANLAAIQREIHSRSPEQGAHQRGESDGAVTYITEPDNAIVEKIVSELRKVDGAPDIARKLYGGLEIPQANGQNPESRLQAMELQSLLANISREIRNVTGSEFSESSNPYASMKNEELATTVERLKQAIQEGNAQGRDTTDFRNRLALAGRVIQGRQ